jgi:hypothetical protein
MPARKHEYLRVDWLRRIGNSEDTQPIKKVGCFLVCRPAAPLSRSQYIANFEPPMLGHECTIGSKRGQYGIGADVLLIRVVPTHDDGRIENERHGSFASFFTPSQNLFDCRRFVSTTDCLDVGNRLIDFSLSLIAVWDDPRDRLAMACDEDSLAPLDLIEQSQEVGFCLRSLVRLHKNDQSF